jgi:hypothetical protein
VSSPSESEIEVDEAEHQALDLLDAVPTQDTVSDVLSDELGTAIAVVRPLLHRVGAAVAQTLVEASRELAQTDDRGTLELGMADEIRLTLAERPEQGLAIAPVVDITGMILGLERGSTAWGLLLELAGQATAEADERLHACSTAIAERLDAAQPRPGSEPSRALRVFRSAAVAQAGPSIRARRLAADHEAHLGLALALVERHARASALVDAFDEARAALQAAAPERAAVPDVPQIDGPKRKFTSVHVILALIVLGLTVWHYVFR